MVLLAQLRQIGFVLHNSLRPIGFVSHGGSAPPLTSNIKLRTSDSSYLYVSPYYVPCCRNRSGKMDWATLRNRRKSLS
jgi:hypothetical protein